MNTEEKLCLKYNDFKDNVSLAFGDLRQDKEFTEMTLVCEDGQQVEAHKLVLIASTQSVLPEHLEEEQTSSSIDQH